MTTPVPPWLLFVLRPRLAYTIVAGDPGPEFTIDGIRYVNIGAESFNWFSDRLIDTTGRWVGIELNPLTPVLDSLAVHAGRLPYLTAVTFGEPAGHGLDHPAAPDRIMQFQMFFTGKPVRDAEVAGEQAFEGRVYADDNGGFALSFGTADFVGISDLQSLSEHGVEQLVWMHQ